MPATRMTEEEIMGMNAELIEAASEKAWGRGNCTMKACYHEPTPGRRSCYSLEGVVDKCDGRIYKFNVGVRSGAKRPKSWAWFDYHIALNHDEGSAAKITQLWICEPVIQPPLFKDEKVQVSLPRNWGRYCLSGELPHDRYIQVLAKSAEVWHALKAEEDAQEKSCGRVV